MTKEDFLKVCLALQHISMSVDDKTYEEKIKKQVDIIAEILGKQVFEESEV